ncbi:hypothetical protein NP493_146g03034 [Ridgeia piscesae]|uniref:Uncharacterized protein n=1 Tax=Ridgeia piscesae TaxID=27915 RepID=A0AAD9UG38_RIDPI|nr:hypothetical protein NP493_146g03034 [Ridgeia piscesae]
MNKCYTTQEKPMQQETSIRPNFVAQPQHNCRRVTSSTFTFSLPENWLHPLCPKSKYHHFLATFPTEHDTRVQMPYRNLISGIHRLQLHSKYRFCSTRNCVEQCHIPGGSTKFVHRSLTQYMIIVTLTGNSSSISDFMIIFVCSIVRRNQTNCLNTIKQQQDFWPRNGCNSTITPQTHLGRQLDYINVTQQTH